ncbi:MAG: DNA polymerase III subunit gamma/tau [Lactobacillales bacterium]|jgi:DNA polymerase-3 subunit gamma/tau|nr:DNA polymerase III subunit gamma/tau [Lactobacillales bacterium]
MRFWLAQSTESWGGSVENRCEFWYNGGKKKCEENNVSYQAIYRTFRPQRFDEVIGQSTITRTLKNAIATKQTTHAYLFTGPRGCGKTSVARIFAKAINCPNSVDGEPCNECETCIGITEERITDVIEQDAASNTGVDYIRDIREKVQYAPTEVENKIFIIDEVHMLSTSAFNALLKTLEEPPANVIFILATTDVHKIPTTVLSRTQRFDFKRMGLNDITAHIKEILDEKGVKYEESAIQIIAKAANGGMRDALSLLDQTLSYGYDLVTVENAREVTGQVKSEVLDNYITKLASGDVENALIVLKEIIDSGNDALLFLSDLETYYSQSLLYQFSPDLIVDEASEQFIANSKTDKNTMFAAIEKIAEATKNIKTSMNANVHLEVLTLALASLYTLRTPSAGKSTPAAGVDSAELSALKVQIQALQKEVEELKKNPVAVAAPQTQPVTQGTAPVAVQEKTAEIPKGVINSSAIFEILTNATHDHKNTVLGAWEAVKEDLGSANKALVNRATPIAASPEMLLLNFDANFFFDRFDVNEELKAQLAETIFSKTSYRPQIIAVYDDKWKELRQDFVKNKNTSAEPMVQADIVRDEDASLADYAVARFGDAVINLDEGCD